MLTALARHELCITPDLLQRYRAPWQQLEEMLFSEWLADATSGRQPRPVRLTNGPSSDESEMVMVPSALLTESLHACVKGSNSEKPVNAFSLHMQTRHQLTVEVRRDDRGDTVIMWKGNIETPVYAPASSSRTPSPRVPKSTFPTTPL